MEKIAKQMSMMRRIILVGLLLLPAFFASAQSVENQLVDAVALYNNRSYAEARTLLGTLSKAAPDNDAVHYYLSCCEKIRE